MPDTSDRMCRRSKKGESRQRKVATSELRVENRDVEQIQTQRSNCPVRRRLESRRRRRKATAKGGIFGARSIRPEPTELFDEVKPFSPSSSC